MLYQLKEVKNSILIAASLIGCFSFAQVFAQSFPTGATASGSFGSDYWIYGDVAPKDGVLEAYTTGVSPVTPLQAISDSAFTPLYAGGNVELFANSDSSGFVDPAAGGAFANAAHTTLSVGLASGRNVVFSSLNGTDWFDTGGAYNLAYGASNLANQWYQDFLVNSGALGLNITAFGQEQTVYERWRDGGLFSRLSDPNISYVYESGGILNFALGGFIDESPRLRVALVEAGMGALLGFVPDGIQISEAVLLNGQAHFGFTAEDSGVSYDDNLLGLDAGNCLLLVDSYTGSYQFSASMPEPSSMMLSLLGLLFLIRRRRGRNS